MMSDKLLSFLGEKNNSINARVKYAWNTNNFLPLLTTTNES